MPYALSFSEDFFIDGDPESTQPGDFPTSVYQAILSMSEAKWNEIACEIFHVTPNHLDPLVVLDRIRQTNTCSNLENPVQVWIDQEGFYDLLVYDGRCPRGESQ